MALRRTAVQFPRPKTLTWPGISERPKKPSCQTSAGPRVTGVVFEADARKMDGYNFRVGIVVRSLESIKCPGWSPNSVSSRGASLRKPVLTL